MWSHGTRANISCKKRLCTLFTTFQAWVPCTAVLVGYSEDRGFHSSLPASVRFSGLFCSVAERTKLKEKLFFGILTRKQAISRIGIFRIEKVRSAIAGVWAGGRGSLRSGVDTENHVLCPLSPKLPAAATPPFSSFLELMPLSNHS